MIDVENQIFDHVATELRNNFTGIYVTGENISAPSQFPAVSLIERSNIIRKDSIDYDTIENQVTLMYEVNIYSNLSSGKKQQARNILKTIDSKMSEIGFTRTFGQPIDNLSNTTIYRYTARYKASVDKNNYVYGGI